MYKLKVIQFLCYMYLAIGKTWFVFKLIEKLLKTLKH